MSAILVKRTLCVRCLRPHSTCICQWITLTETLPEVLILQHPLEVNQAKGSARLLQLSLAASSLQTGETFDETQLQQALYAAGKTPVLLYPQWSMAQAAGLAPPPALAAHLLDTPAQLRLIVLDATWRKSRKMLYLNPLLQTLPRLALSDMPASHYRVRKAHQPDQLSTLEASCYALMQLEKNNEKYQPLLNAFDGFVGQLMRQSGRE